MTRHLIVVTILCLGALLGMLFVPAIPQDPGYHQFADQRTLLGIPNFWDVVSNLPFVLVGMVGLARLARGCPPGGLSPLLIHYRVFFVGVLLTGLGSIYYHLDPDNVTLVWDRLPMTIAFMAFFSALVGESLSLRAGRQLLLPLLLLGMASVIYWHVSEAAGHGDLRPYLLVQFLPVLLTPYLLAFAPSPFTSKRQLWYLTGCYLLAKLLELTDHFWFNLGGVLSGHTLKHLAAAWACYWLYVALVQRKRR